MQPMVLPAVFGLDPCAVCSMHLAGSSRHAVSSIGLDPVHMLQATPTWDQPHQSYLGHRTGLWAQSGPQSGPALLIWPMDQDEFYTLVL